MAENTVVVQRSLGFPGILTIIFVLLKAFGFINWSWWWVFSPLWLPFVIVFSIFSIVFIGAALIFCISEIIDKIK